MMLRKYTFDIILRELLTLYKTNPRKYPQCQTLPTEKYLYSLRIQKHHLPETNPTCNSGVFLQIASRKRSILKQNGKVPNPKSSITIVQVVKLFYILFLITTASSGQFENVSILIFLSLVLQLTLGILKANAALNLLLAFQYRSGSFGLTDTTMHSRIQNFSIDCWLDCRASVLLQHSQQPICLSAELNYSQQKSNNKLRKCIAVMVIFPFGFMGLPYKS